MENRAVNLQEVEVVDENADVLVEVAARVINTRPEVIYRWILEHKIGCGLTVGKDGKRGKKTVRICKIREAIADRRVSVRPGPKKPRKRQRPTKRDL